LRVEGRRCNLPKSQTGFRAAEGEAVIEGADAESDPKGERFLGLTPAITDDDLACIAYFEALRTVKNHHDAEDIAGEAMVRFLAAPVAPNTPGAWVRTVAHRLALDLVERGRRFQRIAPLLVDADQSCVTDEALSLGTEILEEAIALLPARQSEAVGLYYFQELDRAAVAQLMGVSLKFARGQGSCPSRDY
jgi:RNA polymerase sigma factor (sigma-70 family)